MVRRANTGSAAGDVAPPPLAHYDSDTETSDNDEAVDPRAYWLLVLMGAGLLTPWNVMLNSLPYFGSLYKAQPDVARSFAFWLSSVYGWPGLPVLFSMIWLGNHLPVHVRIAGSFALQAVIMALMPFVAPLSFYAPLALMFVNGLCTGLLQSSLFGLTAAFPPVYAHGALLGQGLAGAIASLAQLAVMAAAAAAPGDSDSANATAAYAYFATAAVVMATCAAAFMVFASLPSAQRHLRATAAAHAAHAATESADALAAAAAAAGFVESEGESSKLLMINSGDATPPLAATARSSSVGAVLLHIRPQASALFAIFLMTFLVFPGVMSAIPYKGTLGAAGPILSGGGRWPVILLAVFNLFDTLGRFLPGRCMVLRAEWLLPVALLRFSLLPLFLACARAWQPASLFSDAFALALMAAFSISNGYTASCVFMLTPPLVRAHEQERVGFLLSFLLNLGITAGGQVALAFS